MLHLKLNYFLKPTLVILPALLSAGQVLAATGQETIKAPDSQDLLRYALAGIMILLLLVIAVLGNAVAAAGKVYAEQEKQRKQSNRLLKTLLLPALIAISSVSHAAETVEQPPAHSSWPATDITLMLIFLSIEFIIIFVLSRMLQQFLRVTADKPRRKPVQWKLLFQKVNQTVAVEEESSLDLAHDYDGIRELDNKVPAWWRYAFYATMLFSVVYLYRMFVSHSLPEQLEELNIANEVAALQKEAYLKNAANNIDENNVTLLDASGIAAGAALYGQNCLACHGDKGQGGVGPNLTDDYWLHKGGLKDVFRSIKYGWPEKGMKSWKDDFSPTQIAQLASFVKSLHGSNPAGGKEPQGELYTETATGNQQDSSKASL